MAYGEERWDDVTMRIIGHYAQASRDLARLYAQQDRAADAKRVYEGLARLDWTQDGFSLVRVKNGFQPSEKTSYRSLELLVVLAELRDLALEDAADAIGVGSVATVFYYLQDILSCRT